MAILVVFRGFYPGIPTYRSFLEIKEKTKSKSIEVHSDALRCSAHSAGVHSECHSEWTWKVALTLALALQSQVECFELWSGALVRSDFNSGTDFIYP